MRCWNTNPQVGSVNPLAFLLCSASPHHAEKHQRHNDGEYVLRLVLTLLPFHGGCYEFRAIVQPACKSAISFNIRERQAARVNDALTTPTLTEGIFQIRLGVLFPPWL
jgi:hypothetical protein